MTLPSPRAGRVVEHNALVYRRAWRGSLLVSFVSPLLFLAAMGVGLGSLVQRRTGTVGGVSYLHFVAPGLLAATAMQTAALEATYPVLGRILWERVYDAMLATPLTVADVVAGEVAWFALRSLIVAVTFFAAMAALGVVHSPMAILAIPATVAVGLAFAAPIMAFSATQRQDRWFSVVFRFVVLPLFLLSGTFFPLSRLPAAFQALAWLAPLSHGAALTRGVVLGSLGLRPSLAHCAVLIAYIGAGLVLARWTLARRLVV